MPETAVTAQLRLLAPPAVLAAWLYADNRQIRQIRYAEAWAAAQPSYVIRMRVIEN
jgi:hypothetical protein